MSANQINLSGSRVLIADDNDQNRELLEAYLADEKNQIFTVILALYAGEDEQEVFKDLNNLYQKHPKEVEFYIP